VTHATEIPPIRALVLDVDGVLTDGRMYYDEDGRSLRAFHVQDGLAIQQFRKVGGVVIICSAKQSAAVAARMKELNLEPERVLLGSTDKLADTERALQAAGLELTDAAVMGDDLPDVRLMQACGYAIAPGNAVPDVQAIAQWVTNQPGGYGAVREAIEHILRADGRWHEVLRNYRIDTPLAAAAEQGHPTA
jgi:3-deoxy-D-manno-octulosonate 8-phosphate phosphatase (KDO 8-P phosphatase)